MNTVGFFASMRYVAVGWRLIRQPGLRRFVWVPLGINLAIFGGLGWWLTSSVGDWIDGLGWLQRLADNAFFGFLETLLRWVLGALLLFALAWLFTLLANLVGAPFNGLLAERVEAKLTGARNNDEQSFTFIVKSLPRLMGSELAKLGYLGIWLIPLLLLQFIPVINVVAPFLMFLFGAWMFALEYLDYPMGNHGALFRDVRAAARERRSSALGFGVLVAAISAVPIVNLLIMPVAVAGATALYVDHYTQ